jgi:hypothetical protein
MKVWVMMAPIMMQLSSRPPKAARDGIRIAIAPMTSSIPVK